MRKRILATRVQQVDQAVRLNIAQFLDRLAVWDVDPHPRLPTETAIERWPTPTLPYFVTILAGKLI